MSDDDEDDEKNALPDIVGAGSETQTEAETGARTRATAWRMRLGLSGVIIMLLGESLWWFRCVDISLCRYMYGVLR